MSRHEKLLDRLRDPQRDASWRFTELLSYFSASDLKCALLEATIFSASPA